jgi:uncharacterized membrane protein
MAFEYLVILFPRSRRVKLNGEYSGKTNRLMEIEGGKYNITLGPPENFEPDAHDIDLRGTSAQSPKIVTFRDRGSSDDQ